MNEQDQIKAVAELDRWTPPPFVRFPKEPDYLTSYDAIIPVIQKQDIGVQHSISNWMIRNELSWFTITPAQLCEALLKAVGKWKD